MSDFEYGPIDYKGKQLILYCSISLFKNDENEDEVREFKSFGRLFENDDDVEGKEVTRKDFTEKEWGQFEFDAIESYIDKLNREG